MTNKGCYIRMITHEMDPKVPKGLAFLSMDDNGWVGTNNGNPMLGQPALYPEAQARALMLAWMIVLGKSDLIPHPEEVPEKTCKWLGWS